MAALISLLQTSEGFLFLPSLRRSTCAQYLALNRPPVVTRQTSVPWLLSLRASREFASVKHLEEVLESSVPHGFHFFLLPGCSPSAQQLYKPDPHALGTFLLTVTYFC